MGMRIPAIHASCRGMAAALSAVVALAALCLAAAPAQAAKVTLLQRPVEIKVQGRGEWKPLKVGDEVNSGDQIRTGIGGRCEVTIEEKRVFRIGEASEVVIDQLILGERGMSGKVRVLLGRIWSAMVKPLDTAGGESYTIETPTVTMGIKGTRFDVDYDGKTQFLQTTVLEGQVVANPSPQPQGPPTEITGPREVAPPQQITRGEWILLVSANQKLVFVPGQEPQVVPITDADRADEWIQFNDARDQGLR